MQYIRRIVPGDREHQQQEQIDKYAKFRIPDNISIDQLEAKPRKYKLLLTGKTGTGKSAFGNFLLGREEFKSEPGLTSITGKSKCAGQNFQNVFQLFIIDTPGLADAAEAVNDENALKEISKGIIMAVEDGDPGVDVILFVIAAHSRFTRDQQHVLQYFNSMDNFWPFVIPVFTHLDMVGGLDNDEQQRKFIVDSAKQHNTPVGLKWLLHNVQDRFMVVNSKCEIPEYQSAKRAELLHYLGGIRDRNGGIRYTNDMFKKVFHAMNLPPTLPNTDSNSIPYTEVALQEVRARVQELNEMEECFPGDSSVITKDGVKPIQEIKLGEKLLSVTPQGSAIFSEVVTFLHYEPKTFATYLAIQTESGSVLHVSGNHLVFTTPDVTTLKFKAVFASSLQPGDYIPGIESSNTQIQPTRVTNITSVRKQGVYAPMTRCGTIVVDGSVASCYASYPSHAVAHAVMAPLRIYYIITKQHRGLPIKEGVNPYASFLYKLVY